jgi:hypothetical protein
MKEKFASGDRKQCEGPKLVINVIGESAFLGENYFISSKIPTFQIGG